MDFYILAKSIAYLFLSLNAPTTLVFQEPIEYVSAGKNGDFSLNRSNNQKILVIQPLKEITETNMVIITKDQHFQFKLKTVDKGHHAFVYVYPGAINKTFVKKVETEDFRLLEGDSSVLVRNRKAGPIKVNDVLVERDEYFSKGVPLFINSKRVLN
ncbi:MAG TPA: TrbG/VirB9 family P-type conjugative transfer protein [Bacteriovoracaceae bacterium]|nr:TrbG/VirB9 family P-type conjugative transfer protein [Bacteriovoracaceae bacterium]